ncbi:MAG: helicase-associated domain-containing protein [Anaerolineae bacterium]
MERPAVQNRERLSTSLQAYHINALQEMADTLALRPKRQPVRKDWLVSELSSLIPKRARSAEILTSLSEAERGALGVVLTSGGTATFGEVAVPLILAGLVDVPGQVMGPRLPTIREVLLSLVRQGLVVNLTGDGRHSTLRTLTHLGTFGIAPEVRSVLPTSRLVPPEPRPAGTYREGPPLKAIEARDPQQFMRKLFFAWAELRREPARRLKSGGMGKRDRRRLAQALGLDDAQEEALEEVSELYEMLLALNLVSQSDTTIKAIEGSAVTLFWNATPVHQVHDLAMAYSRLGTMLIDDEKRLYGYSQGFGLRTSSVIRKQVLATVMQVATLGWLPFSLFATLVRGGRVGTLIVDEETMGFVLDSFQWYGSSYQDEIQHDLQQLEEHVIQRALSELAEMGIVDLGYDTSDSLAQRSADAVRATELVRAYQDERPRRGDAMVDEAWQVILQPDFQMLAMGPVPLRVLANLERFAAREKIDETVVTYRLTRDEAYQAFQRGESVESILTYLEEATEQPAPQNVRRSLEEWSQQHERIVLRRKISVMQVRSAELLDGLLEDEVLRDHLHRLDDTIAWLRPEDIEKVENRLFELEILAARSKGPKEDLPNSLRWKADDLETRSALPSLYVTGTLRRIAEPNQERWQITPETLEKAITLGADPLEIIEMLEAMTGRPLPEDWTRRIKAWSKYYGDSQTAQVRLLRLARPEALEELRNADDQLRRWLRPLPGAGDLAVVDEAHWEGAVELLASWGVEVTSERWW